MARSSRDWSIGLAQDLRDPKFAREFLRAAVDEGVDLQVALGRVIRAIGVKEFAARVSMASPNVVRAINPRHNPTHATLSRLLRPFRLRLSLAPIAKPGRESASLTTLWSAARARQQGLRAMTKKSRIIVTPSSGNVFADIGVPHPMRNWQRPSWPVEFATSSDGSAYSSRRRCAHRYRPIEIIRPDKRSAHGLLERASHAPPHATRARC